MQQPYARATPSLVRGREQLTCEIAGAAPPSPRIHPDPAFEASPAQSSHARVKMTTRAASHAGSWYSSRASTLSNELDEWLAQVPASIDGKELPVSGARIIIAP
jgi:hypothetical protein